MSDARNVLAFHKSLDKLAILANEIDADAKLIYGDDAKLFYEASGRFHVTVGDSSADIAERLATIRASSVITCNMEAGAW